MLERWKRTLTALAHRHAVPLWDFNAFDAGAKEQPPPPGDKATTLTAFWEPAHYRAEYGEHMLSTMLGHDCGPIDSSGPNPAGIPLTPDSLENHLATLRRALQSYLDDYPETVTRLNQER